VRSRRGHLYLRLNQPNEAIAEFSEGLRRNEKDPILWRGRANAHSSLGHWAEAAADFSMAMKVNPGARGSLLPQRGSAYIQMHEWEKAAADYEQALQMNPDDALLWFENAYIKLNAKDTEGYLHICGRMFERFTHSRKADVIPLLAHTYALAPQSPRNTAQVQELAEKRITLTPAPSGAYIWSLHVLGLAHYRAGQPDKAVAYLEKGLHDFPDWEKNVLNWLVLALAEFRLGKHELARQWLEKADLWVEQKNKQMLGEPGERPGFSPIDWAWRDWLGLQMLRQEAQELLQKTKSEESKQ